MSGQPNYTIDDMNEILLSGESFFWNGFEVKLIQQKKLRSIYWWNQNCETLRQLVYLFCN